MAIRILICISALIISHASNAMFEFTHRQSKEERKILEKNKKNSRYNLIVKEFFFAKTIYEKNIFPKEIIRIILCYSESLRNRDFANSTAPYIEHWHDFRIPVFYHHILTSKQMDLIQNLLTSEPFTGRAPVDFSKNLIKLSSPYEMHYCLKSKKDYKLFLTLPIELRKCLTKLPSSKEKYNLFSSIENINANKTIQVKSFMSRTLSEAAFAGYTPKLIVPEEKEKH